MHQKLPQRLMKFFMELMMLMMFMAGAGVFDNHKVSRCNGLTFYVGAYLNGSLYLHVHPSKFFSLAQRIHLLALQFSTFQHICTTPTVEFFKPSLNIFWDELDVQRASQVSPYLKYITITWTHFVMGYAGLEGRGMRVYEDQAYSQGP